MRGGLTGEAREATELPESNSGDVGTESRLSSEILRVSWEAIVGGCVYACVVYSRPRKFNFIATGIEFVLDVSYRYRGECVEEDEDEEKSTVMNGGRR